MEIIEVNAGEYDKIIMAPYHIYGAAVFNELNKLKTEETIYLIFKDDKYRMGIIGGRNNSVFCSPFSAPYGGFVYKSADIRIQHMEESINSFIEWAKNKKFNSINITLPPPFYDISYISKQVNSLWRAGFQFSSIELNHSFKLNDNQGSYEEGLWRNARKNLRLSLNTGLQFTVCEGEKEKELVYEIIEINRNYRGHPLRMTLQEVMNTIRIIKADFFLVHTPDQVPIASAVVFHVSDKIVQVIYWGDVPGHSELKPMNFLAYKIFEYYKANGIEYIDIGHSTENSVPNYGLCEFKESIGCKVNPRYSFIKRLE